MTGKNAIAHFRRLVAETTKKSEINVYQAFIRLLSKLERRGLTQPEIESLESKLDALELIDPTKKIAHYKKALGRFERYLNERFSLVTKGYYQKLGIGLGAALGLLLGIVWFSGFARSLGISLGISVGTLIGIIVAIYLESRAKSSGKLI